MAKAVKMWAVEWSIDDSPWECDYYGFVTSPNAEIHSPYILFGTRREAYVWRRRRDAEDNVFKYRVIPVLVQPIEKKGKVKRGK